MISAKVERSFLSRIRLGLLVDHYWLVHFAYANVGYFLGLDYKDLFLFQDFLNILCGQHGIFFILACVLKVFDLAHDFAQRVIDHVREEAKESVFIAFEPDAFAYLFG